MNTNRIKMLGLALPLLAVAVAGIVFAFGNSSQTTEAATDGAAMSLRVDSSQTFDCAGGAVPGKVCVPLGSVFDLIVVADAVPLTNGYILAQAYIAYGSNLEQKKTDGPLGPTTNSTMIWPDGEAATFLTAQFPAVPATSVGALTQLLPPQPPSFYKGDLFSIELTCTTSQSSSSVDLLPSGDPVAGTSGGLFIEFGSGDQIIPAGTGLNINCNPGPKTPKPPSIDLTCKVGSLGGDPQTKCDYAAGEEFTINGIANYADDLDGNGLSGYHGVEVQVTWPPGLGAEKSSAMFCPPGGVPDKVPTMIIGKWTGTCELASQADPNKMPDCPVPDPQPVPAAGCDEFDSFATFEVVIGNSNLLNCQLAGQVQVTRSALMKPVLPDENEFIETEIVFMQLTGFCDGIPVTIVVNPDIKSIGAIEEKGNNVNNVLECPCYSFFDVFVVVQTQTPFGDLHNDVAIEMVCQIDDVPPILCEYGPPPPPPELPDIYLYEAGDELKVNPVGAIIHALHIPEKTLVGPTDFEVVLNCLQPGTHKITASAVFTGEDKEPVPALEVATIRVNCPSTNPRMSKIPALQNVFLTRQGAKIPPGSCLATKGTTANVGELAEVLSQEIEALDPKDPSLTQQLAAFEFEVHYDNKKVCVDINVGAAFEAAGAVCIIEDDQPDSKPQLEGVARIGCVTIGKGHDIDNLVALASVDVYPQPEIYSQAKPNQDNGVVVQISNVNCDLSDEQGHAIKIFACDDADITFRYLEGDVVPDCVVDATDAQAIAFRWGVEKGSLIYKDFMNVEPSGQQQDNDIDINDLQFVFGRFGSTCEDPHPPQLPVNPKA